MLSNPHDIALFTITAGAAVGALLLSDAADEALRSIPEPKRRRVADRKLRSRIALLARPVAFHCGSLAFLIGMATSGAFLVGVFP